MTTLVVGDVIAIGGNRPAARVERLGPRGALAAGRWHSPDLALLVRTRELDEALRHVRRAQRRQVEGVLSPDQALRTAAKWLALAVERGDDDPLRLDAARSMLRALYPTGPEGPGQGRTPWPTWDAVSAAVRENA